MEIPPFLLSSGAKLYPTSYGLLPSVTTILTATENANKRERLRQWQQRHGKSALAQAAARGTAIHDAISAFSKGEPVTLPDSLLPFWEQAIAFLDTLQEIQFCEHRVAHTTQRYAGTLDLAATRFGIPTLFEVKTGEKPKRSLYLEDARHQLAAYWGALIDSGCDRYNLAAIVAISPKEVQLFSLERNELDSYSKSWQQRVDYYRSLPTSLQLLSDRIELDREMNAQPHA